MRVRGINQESRGFSENFGNIRRAREILQLVNLLGKFIPNFPHSHGITTLYSYKFLRVLIFVHFHSANFENFRADSFSRTLNFDNFRTDLFSRTLLKELKNMSGNQGNGHQIIK